MSEKETAEIEISGASITGNIVRDATTGTVGTSEAAAVGSNIQQETTRTENDQRRYDQRTEQREYDQRRDNRQYQQRTDQRQYEQRDDQRGGSVTFSNQDNAILWQAIIDLGNNISSVREKLDDLPNRVSKLEVQFQPAPIPLPVTYLPPWLIVFLAIVVSLAGAFLIDRFF